MGPVRRFARRQKSEIFLPGVSILMLFLRRLNGGMRIASAFSRHY
jgi:hypothetical protein